MSYEVHLHPTYRAPCLWFTLHNLPPNEPALDIETVFRRLVPDQFKEALRSPSGIGGISADVSDWIIVCLPVCPTECLRCVLCNELMRGSHAYAYTMRVLFCLYLRKKKRLTWQLQHHPVTGVPSFFVHPCMLGDAMAHFDCPKEDYLMVWLGLVGGPVGLWVPQEIAMA